MIMLFLLLAAQAPSKVSIDVDCGGGIRPSRHRVFLRSDGTVTATRMGYAPGYASGHLEPDAVLRLSARLDAAGFDQLASPKAKYRVYDGVTCTISRTTPRGTHSIVFEPGSESLSRPGAKISEVRAVLDDAFRLAATVEPQPTQ